MEDKIRILCTQILEAEKDADVEALLVELRDALHQHIESIRTKLGAYPFVVERRVRSGTPPVVAETTLKAMDQTTEKTKPGRTKPNPKRIIAN